MGHPPNRTTVYRLADITQLPRGAGEVMDIVRNMFWSEVVISLTFVILFIADLIVIFECWKHMCNQLNSVLPPEKRLTWYLPARHSVGDIVLKANLLAYSMEILQKHRQYFPSSRLRKIYSTALIAAIPVFVGIILTRH